MKFDKGEYFSTEVSGLKMSNHLRAFLYINVHVCPILSFKKRKMTEKVELLTNQVDELSMGGLQCTTEVRTTNYRVISEGGSSC